MGTRVIDIIGAEPISIAEAKQWLRVYHNNDNSLIEDVIIPAVRSYFERHLDISLIEKRVRFTVQGAEENIRLPLWPVDEIETITPDTLTQEDGVLNNSKGENIDVTYTTDKYVKPEIKTGMLSLLSHWYINRDMSSVPDSVEKIIKSNTRILWFV